MNYYCKLSFDDWSSDLDIYEADGEFVTTVATFQYRFNAPLPTVVDDPERNHVAFVNREMQVLRLLEEAERKPLVAPMLAGKVFVDSSSAECLERVRALVLRGVRVPSRAIEALRLRCEREERVNA